MSAVRSRQRPPSLYVKISSAAVVQLVRIPACHAGGRGFESRPPRHTSRSGSSELPERRKRSCPRAAFFVPGEKAGRSFADWRRFGGQRRPRSNHEFRHHLTETGRQARHLIAGAGGLTGARGGLVGQVLDADQAPVDVLGHQGLLFGGRGDQRRTLVDAVHGSGDGQ